MDTAKFYVGQVIQHTLFNYRGVIVDVDPAFRISAELNAQETRPLATPAGLSAKPWYHVLVDGTEDRTYVSEQNLSPDPDASPIHHPQIHDYFCTKSESGYVGHAVKIN